MLLHKSRTKVQDRDRKVVNQVLRTRFLMQTVKKAEADSNKKEAPVVNSKKMSQAKLAKQINERPQVVQK